MKKVLFMLSAAAVLYSCGGGGTTKTSNEPQSSAENTMAAAPDYDPNRGEGKFTAENVAIGTSLDVEMANEGNKTQEVKCSSCHKLTDEKLVGPGWKGVSERRKPEWIMNFISNPDPMIDKDPEVQTQLEICLVRMPNQGLTEVEARNVLEFMRKNDGIK